VNLLLISDAFPPMRTSGAELMYSLTQELLMKNHQVYVITPSSDLISSVSMDQVSGYTHVQVKALKTKDISYLRRTFAELVNPFIMRWHLRNNSIFMRKSFDGVIWYSPTIFWGPLVSYLKNQFQCPSYLVLRDFFPDWAMHLNLLSQHGIPYKFFKLIERYQYRQANVIGIQSPNNVEFFKKNNPSIHTKLEVLWNWTSNISNRPQIGASSLKLDLTILANKTVFVYAGNLGVAQGLNSLIELIRFFSSDQTVGFLIMGRGSEMELIQKKVYAEEWSNVLFHKEVSADEIRFITRQCDVGLIFLDGRHKSHNIPGKLLTYLESDLQVLAKVNVGNDLLELIPDNNLGQVWAENSDFTFIEAAVKTIQNINNPDIAKKKQFLICTVFSAEVAANQIINALQSSH